MLKFLSLSSLLALIALSFGSFYPGAQAYSSELLKNSETPLLKTLIQKSLEIEDNIDRGKFLWLIQSEGEDLYDEISIVTNLPEEEDVGEVSNEDDDILAAEEKSDPSIALEEEAPTPENDGALIYG